MTNNITNFGVVNFYENPSNEQSDIKEAEVVESLPATNGLFCRITKHAIETGHAQAVEDELRAACVSAPKLVKAVRTNEALGYLDTQNLSSTYLYNLLNLHYGLPFQIRTFQKYRCQ